jgi:23S rRNA (cytosine1962-C5)-methyltransferase
MPDKLIEVVRKRSRAQHAWIFSNEVQRVQGSPAAGDTVLVYERKRLLGSAVYNPFSLIRARLYSPEDRELDAEFIRHRVERALAYRRERLPGEDDFRLLYGESDGLPGLVVDKYGRHFVVQAYSVALDRRLDKVVEALRSVFEVQAVIEKNDFRLRDAEGLPRRESVLWGEPEPRIVISESGVRYHVDITAGQKTGYYFDHRLTRRKVRDAAAGRRTLDVFSYTGSFAINAALGGASWVLAVDASVPASAIAARNADLNGVGRQCRFEVGNAFTVLAELGRNGEQFDLVCLDPPAFIKAQKERAAGLRGYRQINTLAMRLLRPGGLFFSSSCSHYLFWQDMLDMLVAAASDAGRSLTILDRSTQGPDHPVLLSMPESEYLRCFVLAVN